MPTLHVPCPRPACGGRYQDTVAWPGTISMVHVPQRVSPTCDRCGADLSGPWASRVGEVAW